MIMQHHRSIPLTSFAPCSLLATPIFGRFEPNHTKSIRAEVNRFDIDDACILYEMSALEANKYTINAKEHDSHEIDIPPADSVNETRSRKPCSRSFFIKDAPMSRPYPNGRIQKGMPLRHAKDQNTKSEGLRTALTYLEVIYSMLGRP